MLKRRMASEQLDTATSSPFFKIQCPFYRLFSLILNLHSAVNPKHGPSQFPRSFKSQSTTCTATRFGYPLAHTHVRRPANILDMSSSSNKLEHSRHKDVSGRAQRGLGRRRCRFVPTRHRVERGEQTETEPRSRRNLFSRGTWKGTPDSVSQIRRWKAVEDTVMLMTSIVPRSPNCSRNGRIESLR